MVNCLKWFYRLFCAIFTTFFRDIPRVVWNEPRKLFWIILDVPFAPLMYVLDIWTLVHQDPELEVYVRNVIWKTSALLAWVALMCWWRFDLIFCWIAVACVEFCWGSVILTFRRIEV